MTEHRTKYLILGSGAAALSAAQAIRRVDAAGSLCMVSREERPGCKRPLLSKSPLRRLRQGPTDARGADWFRQMNIDLYSGCTVTGLDTAAHRADSEAGSFFYEKCVYALGGENFIPPFPGKELPGVLTVRTMADLRALKRYTLGTDKAVVIGGGVIGLEMAVELRRYGLEVTVLEAMPRLMPRQLDEDTSARLLAMLGDLNVCTGVSIAAIRGEGRVTGVELADGRLFPCGLVMVSCGQKANIALAQQAGIPCGRSVIVDRQMRTGAPDVWACGDCAELDGVNVALWSQAEAQGTTAGLNAAGGNAEVEEYDRALVLNSGAFSLFALGDLGSDPDKTYECDVRERRCQGFAINEKPPLAVEKRFYCQGRLTGGCILGNLSGMEQMKKEILGAMKA